MKQITEAYCSFEVAQLLKEKGFNERGLCVYAVEEERFYTFGDWVENSCLLPHLISAPTHQMAMDFIRSKYKIFIQIDYDYYENDGFYYGYSIIKIGQKDENGDIHLEVGDDICKKYNDIVEAALLYVLKNLV